MILICYHSDRHKPIFNASLIDIWKVCSKNRTKNVRILTGGQLNLVRVPSFPFILFPVGSYVKGSPYTVQGLTRGNSYLFRVAAENEIGQSPFLEGEGPIVAKNPFGK